MQDFDVLAILKLGLPGLVFLLAWFSFSLLKKEQESATARPELLRSIHFYMYVSLALAALTLLAPIVDSLRSEKIRIYSLEARAPNGAADGPPDESAGVCHDASYANRYLLVKDLETQRLTQVFASTVVPCNPGDSYIVLTDGSKRDLGWAASKDRSPVEIAAAPPGLKFILRTRQKRS